MLLDCSANDCGLAGLKIEGADANVISVIGGDYSNCGTYGIEDASDLGCYFSSIHMTGNGGFLSGVARYNGQNWVLRPNVSPSVAGSTQPGTDESVWTRYFEETPQSNQTDSAAQNYWYDNYTWTNGKQIYKPAGAFVTHGVVARSVWDGCYTEGGQSGAFINNSAIVIGGTHGAGVYAYDMSGSGEPAEFKARNGEFVTRTATRTKSLYLGLTRNRNDYGKGMQMSASPGIPVRGRAYMDGWWPGDIVWNEGRIQTQTGITPPLGWRCTNNDPPAVGQPWQFEEIPFPTAGGGSAVIADNSVTTAKLADGSVTTLKIANKSVTNAKLADMPQNTIKGRANGVGTGVPVDLNPTQVRSIIASDSGNGNLFLAGDGTFKLPPAAGGSWIVDYVANRPDYYNLTPPNMTHKVFNTSGNGFHRVFLQNVANGTQIKLSRLRGGQVVEVITTDNGQTLSRKTGAAGNPTIADGGTVFLTKVNTNLWIGEGDFES